MPISEPLAVPGPVLDMRDDGVAPGSMLIDSFMPEFDATRIEHCVINALPRVVYEAMINADLVDAMRRSRIVRALFAVRAAGERAASIVTRAQNGGPPAMTSLRLGALPEHGDWVRLGEDAPSELVFGAIGRFWAAETAWRDIDATEFRSFAAPGYAKIAASLSLRPYGNHQTLLTYEARTKGTDEGASRAFLRYWTVVSPGVGIVMRSALALVADNALAGSTG